MSRGGGMNRSAAAGGGLPPGGPAGGDLNGLYPNPGVIGFRGASFNPQIDNTSDIGSTALRAQDVHAVTFVAHADATDTVRATLAATLLLGTSSFAVQSAGVTGLVAASIVTLERSGGAQFWVTGTGFQAYQAGLLVRTDTLSGAGANTFEFAPGVTSITESWTQDAAAAGGIWGRVGQQGANGFAGGAVAITGGAAGTTGARTAGGELRLFGGAGGGNAGGAAAGGDVVISPGAGSSGGGVSGQVRLTDSAGTSVVEVDGTGLGFFNIGPVARQDIVGSRGTGAALADLLTKLAATGLITDSTVA